ncbi:MAG: toll/interleukin-1 receptor domain-containing protein, partial [Thaumarchaeota archaeon]|nr:toll/interleukin-1 receptor domain-containing protein [Nitrososphaerota archaeon]
MKIFISHSSKDYELAKALKNILEGSESIKEAFVYEDKQKLGKAIDKKITDEIVQSDYLIAIITDDSLSSASVNQELGYAQALGINKIPLIQKNSELGFLIYGDEKLFFTDDDFKEKCIEVRKYIITEGPKPKFSKEEAEYVQKSAHFRYEIKQQLDDILDSVIYRLQVAL